MFTTTKSIAGLVKHTQRVLLPVVALGVAVLAVPALPAAAGGVNPCAADRPCITELYVTPYSVLSAKWTGDWDAYNIRWENPQLVRDADVGDAHTDGLTVNQSAWNRTYRFSVQGCNRRFLQSSKCSPWANSEIALHKPSVPDRAKLSGDTATWGPTDPLTFHVELWGLPINGGGEKFIDHITPNAKRINLPGGWRDKFGTVRLCAANPAGKTCADIYVRANPSPAPAPAPLPPAPATPANFKAAYDNGFGTRIIATWTDTSSEEYYYLTAFSAQTGEPLGFQLSSPAPKLGANSTTFIETGNATAVVGGVEFHLQACNKGGCSAPAKAVVK